MADSFRVIILPRVADELIEIFAYIEVQSPQNASLVALRLIDAIDSLQLIPHRHKVHSHRRDPALTVRSMPIPPFVMYYRVDDAKKLVRVLTIQHGARQQPRRF